MNLNKKILEGKDIAQEHGILYFSWRLIGFLHRNTTRHVMPNIGFHIRNQVKSSPKKLFDDWFFWPKSENYVEGGIIKIHELETRESDKVTIIGGGSGISCVRAAKIVGKTGQITVYEGGRQSVDKVKETVILNEVNDICEINQCIVGEPRNVYGGEHENAPIKTPTELDYCDVLELDCEGSEVDILPDMSIRPRVVIVEIHPMNFDEPEDYINDILEGLGYQIKWKFGHDGIEINENQFELLLKNSKNSGSKYIANGARWPVVVGATLR